MIADALATTANAPHLGSGLVDGPTEREREVLMLLSEGSSNAQIARRLGLSVKTVQNYVSRILSHLHVSDRTQAALRARKGREI